LLHYLYIPAIKINIKMAKESSYFNPELSLSREEMLEYGYKVVDMIVDHFDTLKDLKPVSRATRKEMDERLAESIPQKGDSPDNVLRFVEENVLPFTDHTTHPDFYAFVPSPNNFISSMTDVIATAFNIFTGGWIASPGGAEVEIVTVNWLLELVGFPVKEGGGVFTSGGSMANLTGLTTARKIKCDEDFEEAILYMSTQTHSSNVRAAKILGFKEDQIKFIPVDDKFRMDVNALKNQIKKDKKNGKNPFCILATAGTTNTGAIDPFVELHEVCEEEHMWLHIDGAYGGAAIICEKGKEVLKGMELADSITIDPHKWMFQPYEIGCILVKDHRHLYGTFSENPEYLRDIKGNADEINFYDHGVQLTRRCRGLKLYMSLKTFGLDSFSAAVGHGIELSEQLENYLSQNPDWEILSKASLAIITFRYHPHKIRMNRVELDNLNQYISNSLIRSQEAMIVTTVINGFVSLRMCTINPRTTFIDVKRVIDLMASYAVNYLKDYPG